MKLHPPTAVLGIVAIGLAATTTIDREAPANSGDPRCDVLKSYIEIVIKDGVALDGDKPVFVSADFRLTLTDTTVADMLADPRTPYSFKTSPLIPLYSELESTASVDPKDICPEILEGFERLDWTPVDHSASSEIGIDVEYTEIYLDLSLPAISQDGRQAILTSGFTYAPLAGGGWTVIMQKDDAGLWRILHQDRTWFS